MFMSLDKEFSTYCLSETRLLVYKMKTFSGIATEAVYGSSKIMCMSSP